VLLPPIASLDRPSQDALQLSRPYGGLSVE